MLPNDVTAPGPFSFVQITDLHIGFSGLADPVRALREDLRQIQDEVGNRASFIVATGDLTNEGKETECRMYLEAVRDCRLKIFPVIGNHDYVAGPWEEGRWDAAWYRRLIAPLNYSFDFGGVHFVVYDYTNQEPAKEPTKLPFDRLQPTPSRWLLNHFAAQPKNVPVILLVHDPKDAAFYDPLREFPIVASLSGHWHSSRLFHDGRVTHFNSPSLCFGGIDYSPRAYRLFTWNGEALSCETFPLKQPSERGAAASRPAAIRWSASLGGETIFSSPVVSGGLVFLGLMDEDRPRNGAVVCWDAATGRELWRTRLDASIKNSVEVWEETLFAVTVTGEVVALAGKDGSRRWRYQLGDATQRWVFSSPLVRDGRVFVGQGPHFASLDARTGQPLWVRTDLTTSDWISSFVSPAGDGERIYVGFHWQPQSFVALDPGTGRTVWRLKESLGAHSAVASPALDGRGGLYVGLQNGQLNKLNAATGGLLWQFPLGETWSPSTPCCDGDIVYASGGAGTLFAVHAASGREVWRWECGEDLAAMHPYRRAGKTLISSPRVMGNHLLCGCNDGRLVALDKTDGRLLGSHDFGAAVCSSPAIDGGRIFLAVRDGNLYSLDAGRLSSA